MVVWFLVEDTGIELKTMPCDDTFYLGVTSV
jgi:hypothetical protein